MAYVTAANAAKNIRAALKSELGANRNGVSVRCSNYSMGSSVTVENKDAALPFAVVEEIANREEDIRRDGYGDILSGGNRYVHVEYAAGALADYAALLAEAFDEHGRIDFTIVGETVSVEAVRPDSHAARQGASFDFVGERIKVRYGAHDMDGVARIVATAYGVLVPDEVHVPDVAERREGLESEAEGIVLALEVLEEDGVVSGALVESLMSSHATVQNKLVALG